MWGQFAATSQFYLYGRKHCTQTGYEKAVQAYTLPDLLAEDLDLSNCVYLITGANAGIGKEIALFLARRKATVYIMCRDAIRGEAARKSISESTDNLRVHLLLADCSLESDIRRAWAEFESIQSRSCLRLDGLICNAGALLNTKTMTSEGVETTFAAHLLFGVYLLGSLALPTLRDTSIKLSNQTLAGPSISGDTTFASPFGDSARLIVVSSGGMYNTRFPSWSSATSTGDDTYDGQFAYAYAKRGQVLLCERWAAEHPDVTVVSCHPGWTDSEGVTAAYGEQKKYLQPLRTLWQGAEGIIYLTIAPRNRIESGAFYLDRSPQVKHMPGILGIGSTFTHNTPEEVSEMMTQLHLWSSVETRPTAEQLRKALLRLKPLQGSLKRISLCDIQGDWHVLACIPSSVDKHAIDGTMHYDVDSSLTDESVHINASYRYLKRPSSSHKSHVDWRVTTTTVDATKWQMFPVVWSWTAPISFVSVIVDHGTLSETQGTVGCNQQRSLRDSDAYLVISVPDRSSLWILTRACPSLHEGNLSIANTYDLVDKPQSCQDSTLSESVSPSVQFERSLLQVLLLSLTELGFNGDHILRCATTTHALEKP